MMQVTPAAGRRLLLVGMAWLLAAPAAAAPVTLDHTLGTLVPINAPQVAVANGQPLVLRLSAKGQVALTRQGADQILVEPQSQHGRVTMPVLYNDASGVHVFWRTKIATTVSGLGKPGDKFIYAQSSHDGGKRFSAPQRLSHDGGAFLPRIAGDGQGALYAVWTDERHGPYHIFLNASRDAGRSWKARDIQVDPFPPGKGGVLDPTVVAHAGQVWVAWAGRVPKPGAADVVDIEVGRAARRAAAKQAAVGEGAIVLRHSSDRGDTWTEPVVASRVARQPVTPTLLWANGNLLLYWFDVEGLSGAVSTDDGKNWSAIAGLPVAPVTSFTAAVDPASGRVLLAYTVQPDGKNHALFAISSADGVSFEAPVHLPRKTPHLTTALFPEIATDRSGALLVIWQDYRHMRAGVCARLSKDGGHSWLAEDRCLDDPLAKKPAFFPRAAGDGKGKFHAVWARYTDDRFHKSEVVLTDVNMAAPVRVAAGAASRARLEKRIQEFWKTRITAQWGKSYDFLDPFFRTNVRREAYIGSQGAVKYHDFKIGDIEITESIAKAKLRYTLEIPELDIQGTRHVAPKREEEITQDWIWIDGNWYLAFKDMVNQTYFRY